MVSIRPGPHSSSFTWEPTDCGLSVTGASTRSTVRSGERTLIRTMADGRSSGTRGGSGDIAEARLARAVPHDRIEAMARRLVFRHLDEINASGDRSRVRAPPGQRAR